jgi:hypothetical protein
LKMHQKENFKKDRWLGGQIATCTSIRKSENQKGHLCVPMDRHDCHQGHGSAALRGGHRGQAGTCGGADSCETTYKSVTLGA